MQVAVVGPRTIAFSPAIKNVPGALTRNLHFLSNLILRSINFCEVAFGSSSDPTKPWSANSDGSPRFAMAAGPAGKPNNRSISILSLLRAAASRSADRLIMRIDLGAARIQALSVVGSATCFRVVSFPSPALIAAIRVLAQLIARRGKRRRHGGELLLRPLAPGDLRNRSFAGIEYTR